MRLATFLIAQMFTRVFWMFFLASFTLVLMMAWRAQLRDQIFKAATSKFALRYRSF